MANKETPPPKVEESKTRPPDPPIEEGSLSFEKLDELIAQEDADFVEKMERLSEEAAADSVHIDMLDLDQILELEQAKSFKSRLKRGWKKFNTWLMLFMRRLRGFLKVALIEIPGTVLSKSSSNIGKGLDTFFEWPFTKKLATLTVIAGAVGTGYYIYLAATQELFPARTDLFLLNFEEVADQVETYDPATESELFYDSPRSSQNMIVLPRMFVNLKRSVRSGSNPMGAFEFFVEGDSPEVMIEIKDREYEVRDLFQRTIEEFSFDQLDRNDGKQLLLEKLRREANQVLTRGKVRKIFFKTNIIKP